MKGIPPGLEGHLVEYSSGGDESWSECPPFKHFTNAFVVHKATGKVRLQSSIWHPFILTLEKAQLLLGMKKRGFGVGM